MTDIPFTLRTWTLSAKTHRKLAREVMKFCPESPAAATAMGTARGIMLLLRSIKGYETSAQTINMMKRYATKVTA
jgi:hypothetical protein